MIFLRLRDLWGGTAAPSWFGVRTAAARRIDKLLQILSFPLFFCAGEFERGTVAMAAGWMGTGEVVAAGA